MLLKMVLKLVYVSIVIVHSIIESLRRRIQRPRKSVAAPRIRFHAVDRVKVDLLLVLIVLMHVVVFRTGVSDPMCIA